MNPAFFSTLCIILSGIQANPTTPNSTDSPRTIQTTYEFCKDTYVAYKGSPIIIQSPHYPAEYNNNTYCNITLDIISPILETQFYGEIEIGYDYLVLMNCAGQLVKNFTGNGTFTIPELVTGMQYTLRFQSDSSVTSHGFQIQLSDVCPSSPCNVQRSQPCLFGMMDEMLNSCVCYAGIGTQCDTGCYETATEPTQECIGATGLVTSVKGPLSMTLTHVGNNSYELECTGADTTIELTVLTSTGTELYTRHDYSVNRFTIFHAGAAIELNELNEWVHEAHEGTSDGYDSGLSTTGVVTRACCIPFGHSCPRITH